MEVAERETESTVGLASPDPKAVDRLETALEDGELLKRWWLEAEADQGFDETFELMPGYPGVEPTCGFFADAPLRDKTVPVMGVVQEVFFDRPKVAKSKRPRAARWMAKQIREYALRYYLRNINWSPPQTYPELGHPPVPKYLEPISWYPPQETSLDGERAEQVLYKRKDGSVGTFAPRDRRSIVDLRRLADTYRWVALDMNLFDFSLTLAASKRLPRLTVPIRQQMHLVMSQDLIADDDSPDDGLGNFGPGFAFCKVSSDGIVAYGPEKIEPGIQLESFQVRDDGEVWMRLVFIANRPEKLLNLSIDPLDWGHEVAEMATGGAIRKTLATLRKPLEYIPLSGKRFDPMLTPMRWINALSGGRAGEEFGISKEHLEREILLKHAQVLLRSTLGVRQTWNQIPDWLDPTTIPDWAGGDAGSKS